MSQAIGLNIEYRAIAIQVISSQISKFSWI